MILPELRDPQVMHRIAGEIRHICPKHPLRLMEVCGGHTAVIHRYALSSLLPTQIELLSGPGCPVCVTTRDYIDQCVALALRGDVTVMTFGDLLRVPGSQGSLAQARAKGGDVWVVYSPMDAVNWAMAHPQRLVVFLAIGFETTACTIAAALTHALEREISNFRILSALKTMPSALRALLSDSQVQIDGLILPGHVMTVTGVDPFEFLAREFAMPCTVAGFEPADMLTAIKLLCKQNAMGSAALEIQYTRSVQYSGNTSAQECIERVFEPCSAEWRGLGKIENSGLKLRAEFAAWDAESLVPEIQSCNQANGCRCGEVLRGILKPEECAHFGTNCSPDDPRGACMVSSEGACAAAYQYGAMADV